MRPFSAEILSNPVPRVSDAGALAVEVVVEGVALTQALVCWKARPVLVLELGLDRQTLALQGLDGFGEQVPGGVVDVGQHFGERVGAGLQVAGGVVVELPLARRPVGHVLEPPIDVVGEGDAGAAGDAEVVGDRRETAVGVVGQRQAVAPGVVDVLQARREVGGGFEATAHDFEDVFDAVAEGQRVLASDGTVQGQGVVDALGLGNSETGFVNQVTLLAAALVGVGDRAGF